MNCKGKQVVVYSKLEGSRLERMFCKRKDKEIVRIDWIEDVYDLFKLKLIYYSGEFSVLLLWKILSSFRVKYDLKEPTNTTKKIQAAITFKFLIFKTQKQKIFLYSFRSFYIPSLFVYSLSDYRDLLPFSFHLFSH